MKQEYFSLHTMEEWRSVLGYEGLYEISNFGNVRSLDRIVKWKKSEKYVPGVPIMASERKDGYLRVKLCNGGLEGHYAVHRLVGMAFILNPDNLPEIDHIDRNRTNNHISNLRWADRSSNQLNTGIQNNNKLGEKNIYEYRSGFRVSFTASGKRTNRDFKTLDEARAFRLEKLGY